MRFGDLIETVSSSRVKHLRVRRSKRRATLIIAVVLLVLSTTVGWSQGFTSGSTGADGAFQPIGPGRMTDFRYAGTASELVGGKS